jgi:molecular chaperone GrpE
MGKLEPNPERRPFEEELEYDDEIEILEIVGLDESGVPFGAGVEADADSEEIVLDFDTGETQPGRPKAPDLGAAVAGDADTIHEDRDRLLRLHADFENYKKRVARDEGEMRRQAGANLIRRLLPVLDNFERAVAFTPAAPADRAILDGVVLIFRQILAELRAEGLVAVDTVGEVFDPNVHEAVATDDNSELPSNVVVEELQRGYTLHDRLLRPALVRVNRPEDLGDVRRVDGGGED